MTGLINLNIKKINNYIYLNKNMPSSPKKRINLTTLKNLLNKKKSSLVKSRKVRKSPSKKAKKSVRKSPKKKSKKAKKSKKSLKKSKSKKSKKAKKSVKKSKKAKKYVIPKSPDIDLDALYKPKYEPKVIKVVSPALYKKHQEEKMEKEFDKLAGLAPPAEWSKDNLFGKKRKYRYY